MIYDNDYFDSFSGYDEWLTPKARTFWAPPSVEDYDDPSLSRPAGMTCQDW